ncbi:MAG: helix-turn-helix domain-containing protein [Heliobacteriaceae bacterium]|jgi:transcriptional regulator with XRE-family HTH domain|nr:helix-turn-helix domain-containing protein [Heliobacteriaceae bacterium]
MDKKLIYKKIGRNIQNERKKLGLTQENFAELMDVSWSYVAKIEGGFQNFSIGKLIDIAGYLKIDVSELLKLD